MPSNSKKLNWVESKEFTKKGLRESVINIVILYSGTFIGFLNTLLKVKVLTPDEIGVISILVSMSSILVILINFGLPSAILRNVYYFDGARRKEFYQSNVIVATAMFFVISGIFYVVRNRILKMYDNDLIENFVNLVILFNFVNSLNIVFNTIFRAEELSSLGNFFYSLFPRLLNLLYFTVAIFLRLTFIYFVYYSCFELTLQLFLFFFVYRRRIIGTTKYTLPNFRNVKDYINRNILRYSSIMMLSALASTLTNNSDRLILGSIYNTYSAGILSVVATFSTLIAMLGRSFVLIVHPQLSMLFTKNDYRGIERLYKENTNLQLYLGSIIFIVLLLFGKRLLYTVDSRYVLGYLPLIYLCIGQLINVGTGPCGTIISLSRKYSYDLLLQIILAVVTVTGNFLLIRKYGINGAAIGTSFALMLYNVLKVILVYKFFTIQPYNKETLAIIVVSIVTIGIGILITMLPWTNTIAILAGEIAIVIAIYIVFSITFRISAVKQFLSILK